MTIQDIIKARKFKRHHHTQSEAIIESLSITKNGYYASEDVDGYNPIHVSVPASPYNFMNFSANKIQNLPVTAQQIDICAETFGEAFPDHPQIAVAYITITVGTSRKILLGTFQLDIEPNHYLFNAFDVSYGRVDGQLTAQLMNAKFSINTVTNKIDEVSVTTNNVEISNFITAVNLKILYIQDDIE